MNVFSSIRIGVLLIAAVSPLLTLAGLWQMKEWRIDRLKEHFRAEGFWLQIISKSRLAIIAIGALAVAVAPTTVLSSDGTLLALAMLSVIQILLRKQRYPVWTKKALIIIGGAILVNIAIAAWLLQYFFATAGYALSVLALLQADVLLLSWLLFLPADRAAKKRIMRQAKALRAKYDNATVIGITGSVGKTTTKELIAHILKGDNVLCTPAYVNSEMGVANWLRRELPKYDAEAELTVIVEMGAYKAGEIATLCDIAKPSIGIITYIGTQHVALFGSQEKLCHAKAELIASLPETGTALLNGDNEFCDTLKQKTAAKTVVVATGGHGDIEAYDIEETGKGIKFRVQDTAFFVPLHGTHNVTNALLAIGAATTLGMRRADIAKRLRSFSPLSSTFDLREERGVTILDDSHNASAESFRAAIAWSKAQPMSRKILLTPGLIELGSDEQRIHKALGEQAKDVFDRVICTNKRAADLLKAGYGDAVELYDKNSSPLQAGDLLVCEGRIGAGTISKLLP